MLGRFRSAARGKLQHAVDEVVAAQLADSERRIQALQNETRGQVADLVARLDATDERIDRLEQRARRDIAYALDIRATDESAEFVVEHMPTAAVFWHPHDTLRYALTQLSAPGMALEFGVASGTTLAIIADAVAGERRVAGFDVFTGLPQAWRTGFPAGEFAQDSVPEVAGAQIVPGLFEDTVGKFLAEFDEPVAFAHLDADLYSSTKTVLDLLAGRLVPGAILVFDEFFNYPGWQRHEYQAWTEFVAGEKVTFEYLAYTGDNEQVVIRVD